ncbi:MAG: DUF2339 domain-containing protein [Balneolaceae bacterium]|nr:MAG: DUF2339 domain-containing protein [Balneolaceae bacterium]
MPENDPRLQQLYDKLDKLEKKQELFYAEIEEIRSEINRLRPSGGEQTPPVKLNPVQSTVTAPAVVKEPASEPIQRESWYVKYIRTDLERFIGENLINKVGILITIIGVSIGTRYAIDHDLISPLMRISLGYLLGFAILIFAWRLRSSLPKFSAVLFSGAMAVFYIITFTAYSFYSILAALPAFLLMVLITIITVAASLWYNRQVVAHIALVGAYAVPFLVGGEGTINTLFLYMAIINTGILSVAVYKYWKLLTISAFTFTWLIFGTWYANEYATAEHFSAALAYAFLFFLILYLAALAYKLIREEVFRQSDIWLILANSFVFYGFGYAILSGHQTGSTWLGAFTLGNAAIHLVAAVLVHRSGHSDRNLFYLIAGLAVTFFTIAIPVELQGSWITLLWTGEAVILFWIGRTQQVPFYEKMSYPVLALTFISLIIDWTNIYPLSEMIYAETGFMMLFNIHFLTSLIFISGVSFIIWQDFQSETRPVLFRNESYHTLFRQLTWTVLLIATYFAFQLEIQGFFNSLFIDSKMTGGDAGQAGNRDILRFGTLWVFNYTMVFISLLIMAVIFLLRNKDAALILFVGAVVCTVMFIEYGLTELSILKDHYLTAGSNEPYEAGVFHVGIRYICFLFLGLMIYVTGRMTNHSFMEGRLHFLYDMLLYITLLWMLSDEVILWMEVASVEQTHRLGLTILWGVYAVFIIVLGIRQEKKHLRAGAIILIGITLLKLFFYDIRHLDTIAKTIVFLALGILLLVASYLFNKYRDDS